MGKGATAAPRRTGRLILPRRRANQLIKSHRFSSLVRPSTAPNRLRQKANFVSGFKLIWVFSLGLKILLSENRKLWYLPPVPPERGALAIVTNVGRDAVDAAARRAELVAGQVFACERSGSCKTSGASCGRQSRVVLAPVAGVKSAEVRKGRPGWQNLNPLATVTRRIRRRGARYKP